MLPPVLIDAPEPAVDAPLIPPPADEPPLAVLPPVAGLPPEPPPPSDEPPSSLFSPLVLLHAALPMPSTAMSVSALEGDGLMMVSTLTASQSLGLRGMVQKRRPFKKGGGFFQPRCAYPGVQLAETKL
jgi:hypothetical protein